MIDEELRKLRDALTPVESESYIQDGILRHTQEDNYKSKCECCGFVYRGAYLHSQYKVCPKCSYIQYVPGVKYVPPYNIYKITDENGNDILDFNGKCRLFEEKNQALEYIEFCNMAGKWSSVIVKHVPFLE